MREDAQSDLCTTAKRGPARVLDDPEPFGVGLALKDPLLGLVGRLARDSDTVGDEERRVKAEPKLADQVAAVALLELLEELGRARAGDGAEVRRELFLGHADARVCVDVALVSRCPIERKVSREGAHRE